MTRNLGQGGGLRLRYLALPLLLYGQGLVLSCDPGVLRRDSLKLGGEL